MIAVTVYSAASGKILRKVSVMNPADVSLQYGDGEGVLEGHFDMELFYVADGAAVAKPQKPSNFSVFDYEAKQWVEGATQVADAASFASSMLSDAVSSARRKFITVIPGQEMIYLAKEAEAIRYLALAQEPESLSDFPLLAAEVGITAQTAYQLAQIWVFMSSSWRAAAAQIEAIRLSTAAAIKSAQTVSDALSALSQAKAALDQINP